MKSYSKHSKKSKKKYICVYDDNSTNLSNSSNISTDSNLSNISTDSNLSNISDNSTIDTSINNTYTHYTNDEISKMIKYSELIDLYKNLIYSLIEYVDELTQSIQINKHKITNDDIDMIKNIFEQMFETLENIIVLFN